MATFPLMSYHNCKVVGAGVPGFCGGNVVMVMVHYLQSPAGDSARGQTRGIHGIVFVSAMRERSVETHIDKATFQTIKMDN